LMFAQPRNCLLYIDILYIQGCVIIIQKRQNRGDCRQNSGGI
jgi:hypothetical protein